MPENKYKTTLTSSEESASEDEEEGKEDNLRENVRAESNEIYKKKNTNNLVSAQSIDE